MELATVITKPEAPDFGFQATFSTDRMLLDFGAASSTSLDLKRIERDCDIIKKIIKTHPQAIQELITAVTGETGGEPSRILKVAEVLEQIGFTEQASRKQGGGIIALLILAGAALFAAGCRGCAHGAAGNRPPEHSPSGGGGDGGGGGH
jgi:hypothetical protein